MRAPSSSARLRNASLCDLAEHLDRRHAGERVAAEGAAEPPGGTAVHQLCRAGHAGERQSAAERLARNDQVGLDAVVLDRPDRPSPPDAGLHLVVDVEDPVLLADLLEPAREVRRGIATKPPSPCTGSSTMQATAAGSTSCLKQRLEPAERVVRRDAAVRIRRRRAVHLARERTEALLVGNDLRGHRHRQARAAVERVVEDDHRGPPGGGARDLHGVLDRFGARVQRAATSSRRVAAARSRRGSLQTSTYGSYIPTMKHWCR